MWDSLKRVVCIWNLPDNQECVKTSFKKSVLNASTFNSIFNGSKFFLMFVKYLYQAPIIAIDNMPCLSIFWIRLSLIGDFHMFIGFHFSL